MLTTLRSSETFPALLKYAAKAALSAFGLGLVGDGVDVAWAVASDAWRNWTADRTPEQQRLDIEAAAAVDAARAPQLAAAIVAEVVAEVAPHASPANQARLAAYVAHIPPVVRRTLRRPGDLSGTTLPAALLPKNAAEFSTLLPTCLPRYKAGDRPLAGSDLELVSLLGVGGQGEVWQARNFRFPSIPPSALKFCLDPLAQRLLLEHEARIVDQVMRQGRHPGIVPLLHSYLSHDPPCLEFEYVDGCDLSGLIREHGGTDRLSPERATRLIHRLAGIAGFAHALSPAVVHRDFKPANILLGIQGGRMTPRVADFGIGGLAHVAGHVSTGKTAAARTLTGLQGSCTELYAAPQQLRGDPDCHPADDVFSLGVIWYQMLFGNLTLGCPRGSKWKPRLEERGLPGEVVEILASCLEEERADRPQDGNELAAALVNALPELAAAHDDERAGKVDASLRDANPPLATPDAAGLATRSVAATIDASLRDAKRPSPSLTPSTPSAPTPRVVVPPKPAVITPPPLLVAPFDAAAARRGQEQWADYLRRTTDPNAQVEIQNPLGMRMTLIPPGEYLRGSPHSDKDASSSEKPQHRVRITKPFWLGTVTVTQGDWQTLMKTTPWQGQTHTMEGRHYPATWVGWFDAAEFCNRLSEQAKLTHCYQLSSVQRQGDGSIASADVEILEGTGYRLPTEAEWEYACRAGTTTRYSFGDDPSKLGEYAWYEENTYDIGEKYAHSVGLKKPNPFGLHDMHGNVWEWCRDWYDETEYARLGRETAVDPQGPSVAASPRVVRGGSWNYAPGDCRAALRSGGAPEFRDDDLGFRVLTVQSVR